MIDKRISHYRVIEKLGGGGREQGAGDWRNCGRLGRLRRPSPLEVGAIARSEAVM